MIHLIYFQTKEISLNIQFLCNSEKGKFFMPPLKIHNFPYKRMDNLISRKVKVKL